MAPEITSETGHPALKIVEQAKESGRPLILRRTQGEGFVEELFLGSVAHNVAVVRPWPRSSCRRKREKGEPTSNI